MLKVQIITQVLTGMECKIFEVSSLRCITPYRLLILKQNITSGGINPCQEWKIFDAGIPAPSGEKITDHRILKYFYFLWEPFQKSDHLVCKAQWNYFEIPCMSLCLCSELQLSANNFLLCYKSQQNNAEVLHSYTNPYNSILIS